MGCRPRAHILHPFSSPTFCAPLLLLVLPYKDGKGLFSVLLRSRFYFQSKGTIKGASF